MGLSASQGRLLLLTARQNDLEYQAQQISQQRLALAAKLDDISQAYENATNNRQMTITMQASDGTSVISNLTYAKLVSGAAALGASSGLNQVEGINTSDDANSQAFRLSDGNSIIVSDISEIPGKITTSYSNAKYAKDNETGASLYTQTEKEVNSTTGKTTTITNKYFSLDKIKNSALEKEASSDELASGCEMVTDGSSYYIKFGNKYYDFSGSVASLSDAKKDQMHTYTYDNGKNDSEGTVQFVHNSASVKQNVTKNVAKVSEGDLENNRITINGVSYLVDKDLADNGSNVNYLQNCLRNGKYIIEKFYADSQALDDPWKEVSWDSASNIADQYYEKDDAAAKAKYDRLTKQVETQDKKLQLDLDNVETQRDAVKTEMESVQKVINENIEKTFDAFG